MPKIPLPELRGARCEVSAYVIIVVQISASPTTSRSCATLAVEYALLHAYARDPKQGASTRYRDGAPPSADRRYELVLGPDLDALGLGLFPLLGSRAPACNENAGILGDGGVDLCSCRLGRLGRINARHRQGAGEYDRLAQQAHGICSNF